MTEKEEKKTENSYKSFKDALVIHITAPTREQSNEALYLAEYFSDNLTEKAMQDAKKEVDDYIDDLTRDDPSIKKSIKIDDYLSLGWNEELDNLDIFDLGD